MKFTSPLAAWALALITSLLVAACGGGGNVPATGVQLRPLSADFTKKAVSYSPYRTAINNADLVNEIIPESNIKQDLDLMVAAGFGMIRVFDSSDKVARQTLKLIRQHAMPIKMQLGIYVQSGAEAFSQQEIARGIALANEYSDIVIGVSVGNETMVSWSFNKIAVPTMIGYIKQVRAAVTQPVTTDDNYALFASAPRELIDVLDYVALHTYPELDTVFDPGLWDWRQANVPEAQRAQAMINAAIAEANRQYLLARDRLDSSGFSAMPIIIGETGWNAVDLGALKFRAHPVNQKMYYDALLQWADKTRNPGGPLNVIYFEAFDEPWKLGDDRWGLWNVNREARYVIKDLNPPSATWKVEAGNYTAADAVYFVPPVINAPVTQDRYVIYSEAVTASEFRPTGLVWDPFVKTFWQPVSGGAPGDGAQAYEIDPRNEVWGWGLLYQSRPGVTDNLSNYANGTVNFSIRSNYAQKLEIGISTETELDGPVEAYIQLSSGQYGYCNNNEWCQVSIPLQAFVAANPKIDLRMVLSRFVIADRFAFTGNAQKTNLPKLYLDGVYWAR